MKIANRLIVLLAALLTFSACTKENEIALHDRDFTYTVDNISLHVRDITYTVGNNTTTVHLTTDAEWQTLLDRFCNYAQDGKSVTFQNSKKVSKRATKDAVTYNTTNREEMKRWMAKMEEQGKTVTVTYDPGTGTWNGTAYTAPPTNPEPQGDYISGVLGNAPIPMLTMSADEEPTGLGWTLQMGDTAIWLVTGGNFITVEGPTLTLDDTTYNINESVTLCGRCYGILDYYGYFFPILILDGTYNYPRPSKKNTKLASYN